jgi:uncharacterized damage-inducible protein DinB
MDTPVTIKQILLEEAEKNYAITEKLFRKVENSMLDWKPPTGSNWMTVGQLLMHCSKYGSGMAVKGFVRGDWDLPELTETEDQNADQHFPPAEILPYVDSVEQALELLEEDRKLTLQCIEEVKDDDLLTKKPTAPWGGPPMTLYQYLLMMIAHLTLHKSQLFYYLKLMGKDVDTFDLWGE